MANKRHSYPGYDFYSFCGGCEIVYRVSLKFGVIKWGKTSFFLSQSRLHKLRHYLETLSLSRLKTLSCCLSSDFHFFRHHLFPSFPISSYPVFVRSLPITSHLALSHPVLSHPVPILPIFAHQEKKARRLRGRPLASTTSSAMRASRSSSPTGRRRWRTSTSDHPTTTTERPRWSSTGRRYLPLRGLPEVRDGFGF